MFLHYCEEAFDVPQPSEDNVSPRGGTSDRACRISTGASEVSAVGQTNGTQRVAHGGERQGLYSPLGTAAQFLHEPPSFLWAHGIPEPCTLNRAGQRRRRGEGVRVPQSSHSCTGQERSDGSRVGGR